MRIAIVEDEGEVRSLLRTYIRRFEEENNIEIQCSEFGSGVELTATYQPVWDLILMDIEMPVMDGMTAARQIREMDMDVMIMFITRFSKYAVGGYAVEAFDYLLKPVEYEFFAMKMRKAVNRLQSRRDHYLLLRGKEGLQRVPLRSVYYIEVYNHTLKYHTSNGDYTFTGSRSIRALEEELSDHGFARCSQSYLVNLRYVDTVDKDTIAVIGGTKLPISRGKKKKFLEKIMNYWEA